MYVAFAVRAPVDCVPEVAFEPVQPPEAVHAVALLDDHVSVELLPEVTLVGLAVSVTVGAVGWLTVTIAVLLALPPDNGTALPKFTLLVWNCMLPIGVPVPITVAVNVTD